MAVSKVTLAFALLVICCSVFAADEKFKCYKCDQGKVCEDKKDNSHECEAGEKLCYIKEITDGYERGCTASKDICKDLSEEKCSTCDKSECNSASGIASSLALSAVAALLLKAFY
ncbi:PREDICTED: uncharacterized protein LOC108558593 [Nicrophorus vespilloides]|uniref:Uncharacterized protein LOC108558593 n=1 Tax=Nicrophorus vespilloides TaxID=110193 RepID=A0ABM1M900_NICVS|nr:PREDICTED: uncharacterized protein LOC108558593 [Nicrophorus vespilloides]